MQKQIVMGLLIAACTASCGRFAESRVNPFNWFGGEREVEPLTPGAVEEITDARPLVDEVASVQIDLAPGGGILRATGLPRTQGHWNGELVLDPTRSSPDRLTYLFRISRPIAARPVVSAPSREVVVATFISDQALSGIRDIQVLGAQSAFRVTR